MRCKSEYRDKEKYRQTKRRQSARYRKATGSGQYWNHWTPEHLRMVMLHEQSDRELSKMINHSVSAIQSCRRRIRLGEVTFPDYNPKMDKLADLSTLTKKDKEPR